MRSEKAQLTYLYRLRFRLYVVIVVIVLSVLSFSVIFPIACIKPFFNEFEFAYLATSITFLIWFCFSFMIIRFILFVG